MEQQNVIDCYNLTANDYAANLFDELNYKPLDRMMLSQFAKQNAPKGSMIDLGCGPGQTTRFLADNQVADIIGTDLSPAMIAKAKELSPGLNFEVADMLGLTFADNSFASAVAFYAIVHFNEEQINRAFTQINRILVDGGQFLLSFHIGNEVFHRSEFFGVPVDIDFFFMKTDVVIRLLKNTGFKVIDVIERYPYVNVEHPTKRAYIWAEKNNAG